MRVIIDFKVAVSVEVNDDHIILDGDGLVDRVLTKLVPHPDDLVITGGPNNERFTALATNWEFRTE